MPVLSDVQHHYNTALDFYNQHDYENAEKEILIALSEDDNDESFRLLYYQVLIAARKWKDAEKELLKNNSTGLKLSGFYNEWGNNLFNEHADYAAAEEKYREAIEHDPESYIDYTNLGLALSAQKKATGAIDAFKKAIEISTRLHPDEKYTNAYLSLSTELSKTGKWDEAEQQLLQGNVLNTDLSLFYNAWGNELYNVAKNYAEAETKYRKAIEYNPNSYIDYRNLGLALSEQKKSEEAINAFQKSIRISETSEPNNKYADAYLSLAEELGKKGKWEESEQQLINNVTGKKISTFYNSWGNELFNVKKDYVAAEAKYRKAIEHDPDSFIDYRNLGLALNAQGKIKDAIENFRIATEVYQVTIKNGKEKVDGWNEYLDAFNDWGLSLLQQNFFNEAKEKFEKCISINPEYVFAYENLGFIAHKEKKYDAALDYLNYGLKISPDSTWALFRKGVIYEDKKLYQDAIDNYEAVLRIDNSDAFAKHNIANIYWQLGLYEKSREKWNDAVSLYKQWMMEKHEVETSRNFYLYYGSTLNDILGLNELAKSVFMEGLKHDPENYYILSALGILYRQLSEEDEDNRPALLWQSREFFVKARTILEKKLLSVENTDAGLLSDMTQLLLDMDDFKSATLLLRNMKDEANPTRKKFPELLTLLEETDPNSAFVKSLIGVYNSRIEDYKKATGYFQQALSYAQDDLGIWSNLAETYLKQDLFEKAYTEYNKILRKAPCHVESLIGLGECCIRFGEKGDDDFYELAIKNFNKALDLSRTASGSKVLRNKEKAALLYSRGLSNVQIYEKSKNIRLNNLLQIAANDFKESYNIDKDKYKSKIAYDKVKQRLQLFSTQRVTEKIGPGFIFFLALFVFICIQVLFIKSYFIGIKIIDLTSYSLFTFGSMVFMIAALYLPNVLKLKVAGIELEKSSIDLISTSGNLGISRDTGSTSSTSAG